ncbi:MAG: ABC transporter substrate-binding protein [Chloroflexi bacterium]|nr:ABC transporter substrate-binding protein [Chloroflexota bacterium]
MSQPWSRRRFLFGTLGLGSMAAVPLLAACQGAPAPAPTAAPTAKPAAPAPTTAAAANPAAPAPTTAAAPKPAAPATTPRQVARNRTLVSTGWDLGSSNQIPTPTNFNPYAGVGFNTHQRNALHYTINEMLFYTNYNDGKIIPWLGESWKMNSTFTEVTVTLRKGVKWADGQPFTAKDVVFTLDAVKAAAPDLIMSTQVKEWVKEAVASDDLTVKITLNKSGPRWAGDYLASGQAARIVWLPEHVFKGQNLKTFEFYDPAKNWPFGTGPYMLAHTDTNSIMFDRRDSWWAKDVGLAPSLPAVERVIVKPATAEAMPQLYVSNDLDVGGALTKGNFEAARAQNPKLATWADKGPVWGGPDGCVYRVAFNVMKPPFDDPEIRWAINYAIDREQLVNLAYEGGTSVAVAPFSSYGVQKYVAFFKDIVNKYNPQMHDLKKTEEILTRKGYKRNANGKWMKPDGSVWQLTLMVGVSDPQAPVITEQLQAAGFDAVWKQVAGNERTIGDFELTRDQTCGSIDDPWQTLRYFHSKYALPLGQPTPEVRAITRYKNPELDALLDKMEAMQPSPDDPAYVELTKKATDILLRDMPSVYTAEERHVVMFNTTYWTGWPSAATPYVAPYIPWEGFALVIHRLKPTS